MIKEIKLPLNMGMLEVVSIISFIAIGYSLLYRYAFYYYLGISWYINTLNSQYIVLSSLKIIFTSILSICFAVLLSQLLKDFRLRIYIVISIIFLILIFLTLIVIFFIKDNMILYNYSVIFRQVFIYILYPLIFIMFIRIYKNQIEILDSREYSQLMTKEEIVLKKKFYKNRTILVGTFTLFVLASIPYLSGKAEAKFLLKNKEKVLNSVKLTSNHDTWYLLESYNDKALLIKEAKKPIFKIVEVKDIDEIIVN
ncbi:hypothetical protein [Acinetobacter radioresistens]|uniref:hypothetical protein n=1 Tax=Acinetobacter radioresistens TaxID=40216 RepID=UPI002247069C|nr:hypothetical protein [Acinetobacter radioresistens]MCX0334774.1 hypothetical protein [Acinetobacter radioresistens]